MDGIVVFAIIVAGLAFLGAVARAFGVDSRVEFGDPHGQYCLLS